MPTQNVYVTKSKNRFLPAIQAFTDYLAQYREQQMNIAEKMYQLQRKQKLQEYGGALQERFAGAKSQEEVIALTGQTLGETLEAGYNELIPMIGQFSSIYSRGMEMEQEKRGAKATLETLDDNQKIFLGNQMMTIGEVKKNLAPQFGEGNEKMLYDVISKMPKAEKKELITRDATNNKIVYSTGIPDPSGNWLEVENKDVLKSGATPYIEKNKIPGMQKEEELNPLLMQQYSTAMYQQTQAENDKIMMNLRMATANAENERFSFTQLQQMGTNIWRAETGLFEEAFMRDLEEQVAKAKENNVSENEINLMQTPGSPQYKKIRNKWFSGGNLDQPLESPENIQIMEGVYGSDWTEVKKFQKQKDRWETAVNNSIGIPEYIKLERAYLEDPMNKTKEKKDEWDFASPQAQFNAILTWKRNRKK